MWPSGAKNLFLATEGHIQQLQTYGNPCVKHLSTFIHTFKGLLYVAFCGQN